MTRLRYETTMDGSISETKEMIAREKVIKGQIVLQTNNTFDCHIIDVGSGTILVHKNTDTFNKAKKIIKNKFKDLGVLIFDEVRKKLE